MSLMSAGGDKKLTKGTAAISGDGKPVTTVTKKFTAPKEIQYAPTGTIWIQTDVWWNGSSNNRATAATLTCSYSGNTLTLTYKRVREAANSQEYSFSIPYFY